MIVSSVTIFLYIIMQWMFSSPKFKIWSLYSQYYDLRKQNTWIIEKTLCKGHHQWLKVLVRDAKGFTRHISVDIASTWWSVSENITSTWSSCHSDIMLSASRTERKKKYLEATLHNNIFSYQMTPLINAIITPHCL